MKLPRLIFLFMLGSGFLRAANPGDEVVVVYNSRVAESKSIAQHYAKLRQVPTNQIFGFDLSTGIEMSRMEFADKLQKPLAQRFEKFDLRIWKLDEGDGNAVLGLR